MNLGHFYGLIKCMLNLPQNDMLRRSGLPNKAQRLSPSCQLLCCFERLEIGHSFLCAASPYCKGGHTDSNDGLSPYCTSSEFSVSLVDRVSLQAYFRYESNLFKLRYQQTLNILVSLRKINDPVQLITLTHIPSYPDWARMSLSEDMLPTEFTKRE